MSKSKRAQQIPLFEDGVVPEADPTPRPWRATPADAWSEEELPPLPVMEQASPDLLCRNLEFLRAMDLHAGEVAADEVRQFRERHEELVGLLVRWRIDDDEECAREAATVVKELTDLRLRALERLEPARLRKVMVAEPRVRSREHEALHALSMAEFELAEERGDLVEIEIPAAPYSFDSAGLLGPDMVEDLLQAQLDGMKAEQERRPLPAREGLGTLLRDLPVEWLDAIWQTLELGSARPRHRKERERTIARHLTAEGTLAEVVGERLSGRERELLAFLLERGGKAPANAVARRFGSDDGDGWFWDEEPPASVLGGVRIHGLAFVGADRDARAARTVLVPRELREGLEHVLAGTGTDVPETEVPEGEYPEDTAAPDLRRELVDALSMAFPDGVVEPLLDTFDMEVIEGEVRKELDGLEGAGLHYWRTLAGEESWHLPKGFDWEDPREGEEWEGEEDREDGDEMEGWEPETSYALFFLSPRGEGFQFEIDGEFMDEEGGLYPTKGVGRIGWAVAVSGIVPYALLRITSIDTEDYFGPSRPDLQSRYTDTAGRPMGEDEVFRDMLGAEERGLLDELRLEIVRILESSGIPCLSEEELGTPLPWLEAAESVLVRRKEEARLTVEDALFFQHFG